MAKAELGMLKDFVNSLLFQNGGWLFKNGG